MWRSMTAVIGFGSGGGVYQLDAFYDAADELGVLLYHVRTTCATLIHLSQPSDLTVLSSANRTFNVSTD